jgi:hypothetical protein
MQAKKHDQMLHGKEYYIGDENEWSIEWQDLENM